MTNAEKIAALEAAKSTLEDMIIVTARTFTEFGSAEHAQVGHIAALYNDLTAIGDLLWELQERERGNDFKERARGYLGSEEAMQ